MTPRWQVIHGDCREVLPTLGQVDHVITDPPFEKEAHTLQRRVKRSGGVMEIEALSFSAITQVERMEISAEIARLAKRWAIVFSQVEAVMEWQRALTTTNEMAARRIGVWVKPDAMPQFSGDRPGMGYESIVFAHRKGRSQWNGGGRVAVFTHNIAAHVDEETQRRIKKARKAGA